jgi:hypothetical protein
MIGRHTHSSQFLAAPEEICEVNVLSERMKQALGAYCNEMDYEGIAALGKGVADGRMAWFRDEFRTALLDGDFTPAIWEDLTGSAVDYPEEPELLDKDLREVWTAIAPGEPFPLD